MLFLQNNLASHGILSTSQRWDTFFILFIRQVSKQLFVETGTVLVNGIQRKRTYKIQKGDGIRVVIKGKVKEACETPSFSTKPEKDP